MGRRAHSRRASQTQMRRGARTPGARHGHEWGDERTPGARHGDKWGSTRTPGARRTQTITDAIGGSGEAIRARVRYVPAK